MFIGPYVSLTGPGDSSYKALGYGLADPGSSPSGGGVKILLHSFRVQISPGVYSIAYKMRTTTFSGGKMGEVYSPPPRGLHSL